MPRHSHTAKIRKRWNSWLILRHLIYDLRSCADEEVELEKGALETLAKVSRGDLRRAITSLQSAYRLKVALTLTPRTSIPGELDVI